MTLFERTKEISKKRGMSLQDTAKLAGIGINSIYQWKKQTPSVDRIKLVADVLNVSVDYLLGNTDDIHANKNATSNNPVDLKEVAENDNWDDYLSADGRPLTEHDKKLLRAIFGD